MSWQATAWVSTVEAGGPSGKLLLYALANYADEEGRCWPSDQRLMRDTELSERAIRDWKRKLEEAGLIVVERRRGEAGTFRVDEIRLAMGGCQSAQPPANSAGGESPTTGKWCRDHRQMVPQPPANGAVPPTPPYKAEPSEEPPVEPEREARASEQEEGEPVKAEPDEEAEDPKRVDAEGWALLKDWPGFAGMPKEPAMKVWRTLTPGERAEAKRRFRPWLALLKAQGKSHIPAPSTYFREKLFQAVPEQAAEKPAALEAKPFGALWAAARLKHLMTTRPRPVALTHFQRRQVEAGEADAAELMRESQARHGWPAVNAMHREAEFGRGISVAAALETLAALMEPVPVGCERWEEWRLEHRLRGWPWLPDTGRQPVVYFPKGGPEGLTAFRQALGEVEAREAAE